MPDPVIEAAVNAAKGPRQGKTKTHKGPIHSSVAGRTDHLPMHVASGSYVIPADIISALGEGNSMAGFKVAKSIFEVAGPYGQKADAMPYGGGEMPYGQPSVKKRATGGNAVASARIAAGDTKVAANRAASANYAQQANARDGTPIPSHLQGLAGPSGNSGGGGGNIFGWRGASDMIDGGGKGRSGSTFQGGMGSIGLAGGAMNMLGISPYSGPQGAGSIAPPERPTRMDFADGGATDAVPIVAAGGEYVVPPEDVAHIGGGSLDDGHKILDAFVKKMRKKTIRTLQSLPGPKKD